MSAETIPLDREAMRAVLGAPAHTAPEETHAGRPSLHLAPAPSFSVRKKKLTPIAGALAAVGIILVTLIVQLGLSIAVSEGAYEARALQVELRDLTRVERVLTQNAAKLSSPQNLAQNAVSLGMVQNLTPATLRLSDGAVLGAIAGPVSTAQGSLIANATLDGLPIVDANGLLAERNPEQAAEVASAAAQTPIPWEGPLPAPVTH
ncbi:MAG: hypothetical protein GX814_08590 [Microbacteriaceae bacterium]|nr:hypothetical protein [Microbacteriaceae bacterium]